jgi:CubicO group peptidase (beta-lactamase class C family)
MLKAISLLILLILNETGCLCESCSLQRIVCDTLHDRSNAPSSKHGYLSTETVPNERRQIIPHRTAFYELNDEGTIVHTPYFDPSFKWAGAGFLSTACDLVRFGQAMMRPGFLSENTWDEITTPIRTVSGERVFALGWDVFRDVRGRKVIAKSGGGPGIRGYLGIYPEQDLTVAILSNRSRAPVIEESFSTVVDAFLQESAPGR